VAEMSANLEVRRKVFLVLVIISLVKLVLGKDDDLAVWSHLRGHTHTSNYHNFTINLGNSHHTTSQRCIYIQEQIRTFQVVCYLLSDLKVLC